MTGQVLGTNYNIWLHALKKNPSQSDGKKEKNNCLVEQTLPIH